MRGAIYTGILALFIAVACNLGGSATPTPTPEPILTSEPTGKPRVSIVSPSSGAEFTVDEPVLVSVNATDSVGITRIQLFAEGAVVKTITAEDPAGEPTLSALLDYTPRAAGEVNLQVLAFRNSTPSDPVEIAIVIMDEDTSSGSGNSGSGNSGSGSSGSGSSGSGGTGIQIPNDGICRALTNVGLNFRSQPTTAVDNIITTLPAGTLAPIIARLPDNSWWKLQFGINVGWVSAQFTTEYGICSNVPVEVFNPTATPTATSAATSTPTNTPPPTNTSVPQRPDLIIPTIVVEDDAVIPSGETEVTVTIAVTVTNIAFGSSGPFAATMRIGSDTYDLASVSGLGQSQSIVLTQDVTFDAVGEYDVRVDVDPDDLVDEVSEVNNRGDITIEVTN